MDVKIENGISGKKGKKKYCVNMELMKILLNRSVWMTGQILIPTDGLKISFPTGYRVRDIFLALFFRGGLLQMNSYIDKTTREDFTEDAAIRKAIDNIYDMLAELP